MRAIILGMSLVAALLAGCRPPFDPRQPYKEPAATAAPPAAQPAAARKAPPASPLSGG